MYLWEWFWELAQGRPLGPEGVQMPIPSVEIRAWSELAGVQLLPWELTVARIQRLCDPHFGIGSDGVLLLAPSEESSADPV